MTGFQQTVNRQPAPAIEGDFANGNPRSVMPAGLGGLVAGSVGVICGRFAFVDVETGVVSNAKPGGGDHYRVGFVTIHQMALNPIFEGQSNLLVAPGREISLHVDADVWARFAAGATPGQKAFASTTDGTLTSAAAGATVAGSVETQWYVVSVAAANELAKISTKGY